MSNYIAIDPMDRLRVKTNQMIEAKVTAKDSHYTRVRGSVQTISRGYVQINATQYIDRWSTEWKDHPTSCGMGVKIEDVIAKEVK